MAIQAATMTFRRAAQWSLRCGVAAPLVLALIIIIAALLTPGYNHISQTVSRLGVDGTPFALLLNSGFALYGLLINIFAYGLYRSLRSRPNARLIWGLLAAYGAGTVLIGLFPDNPIPNPTSIAQANLHNVFSLSAYLAAVGAMAAVFISSYRYREWRGLAYASLAALLLVLLLSPTGSLPVFKATEGLWQRLSHLIVLAWIEFTALRALR